MRKLISALVVMVLLAGCDAQRMMAALSPKDEVAIGFSYIEDVRSHNYSPVVSALAPQYRQSIETVFPKIAQLVPSGKPLSVKLVGSRVFNASDRSQYVLTWEYQFPKIWVLAQIAYDKVSDKRQIYGLHFTLLQQSLEEANAFTFQGKSWSHFLILVAAILIPLFVIGTAIACWFTPIPRRKWLWMLFVLVGLMQINFNWTTGYVGYRLLYLQLLGMGWQQELYGPIIIQLGLPIGALIFWWKRRGWLKPAPTDIRQ